MEGNPSGTLEQQVAYLLTQVSSLTQANQDLTTALDAQTQKLLLLEASVQGEVANLTTNQDSLQTILSTHSQSLSNESTARGVVDNGLTVEVIDLKDQHLNDHTYLIGLVEEHHGEWMAASASHTGAMIAEQQARLVGDETNANRIESVRTELVSKVDALDAEVATYNNVLDFTTMDTLDLTMDSEYPLDWSLLSASQEWRFEIDAYLRNAKKELDTQLAAAEQAVAEASALASEALANTDVASLVESLQGNIGIEALDNILWGKVSRIDGLTEEILAETAILRAELLSKVAEAKAAADQAAADILTETLERVDAMAVEAQVRSDQIALKAAELQNGITLETQNRIDGDTAVVGQLNAYKTSNDAALAAVIEDLSVTTSAQEATATSLSALTTTVTNNDTSVRSLVATEATSRATADTALSNQITQLESSTNTALGTKADASALNNYYTKTEADTAAAGQISAYDASLVIGGSNLQSGTKSGGFTSYVTGGTLTEVQGNFKTTTYKRTKSVTGVQGIAADANNRGVVLKAGQTYTVTAWVRGTAPVNYVYMMASGATGGNTVMSGGTTDYNDTTFVKATYKFTAPADRTNAYIMLSNSGAAVGTWFEIAEIMVQEGSKFTDWSESPLDIRNSISANAAAITATNATVSNIDGRVTSNSNAITSLTSQVNGKADSSALTALETRTTNVEGTVSTQASSISSLTSRMTTVEGVANTALNNAATAQSTANTAVSNNQATATTVSSLQSTFAASNDSDSLIPDYLMKDANCWRSHYGYDLSSYFTTVTDGKVGPSVFKKPTSVAACFNYSKYLLPNTRKYKLSMWVRRQTGSTGLIYFTANTIGVDGVIGNTFQSVSKTVAADGTWQYVEHTWDLTGSQATVPRLGFGFALNHSASGYWCEMQGFKVESVLSDADVDSTKVATKAALDSVQTTLASADSALSTRIDTLSTTVDGKANASVLTGYYTKSEADSAISSGITSYDSSLAIGGENLLAGTRSGGFQLYSSGGTVAESQGNFRTTTWKVTKTTTGAAGITSKVENRTVNLIAGEKYIVSGWVRGNASLNYTYMMNSKGDGINTGLFVNAPGYNDTTFVRFTAVFTATVDRTGAYLMIGNNGAATGQWQEFAELQVQRGTKVTDWSDNSGAMNTKITEQAASINGIMGIKTVTIDNNGVLSGYGLVSELKDGQVTSGFGINADQFYVGAPANGKKPFVVLTTQQTINGRVYPAGTWIDAAYIASATIGTAHIANLAVDSTKIADLAVGTAKIVDLAVTGAKIANATIGSAQIADAAITSAKIGDAQITNAKISNGAVGSINIVDGAVTTAKIGDLQVDTLKIKDDAVTVSVAGQNVNTLAIVCMGGKVRVDVGLTVQSYSRFNSTWFLSVRLKRNGVVLYTLKYVPIGDVTQDTYVDLAQACPTYIDNPGVGTHTYTVEVGLSGSQYQLMPQGSKPAFASGTGNSSISLMETKK